MIVLALTSQTQSAADLYNVADTFLMPRLTQLEGVSSVDIAGAATPAIRVDVDLRKLNAMGLSPDQLRNALTAANVTSPLGTLSNGVTNMMVTANDQLHTADDFAQLIVAVKDGTPVRLSDVAHVYAGQQDAYQAATFGHKPAILMYVYKKADANVIATVDRVRATLPELRSFLQPATTLTPVFRRHADHPRLAARGAGDVADQPGDGGADHGAVPAPAGTHADRRGRGAALAGRRGHGDVHPRLHAQQPHPAGAGDRDRLRGGRRHRGDREHHPAHRRGHAAAGGGAARAGARSASPSSRSPPR